MKITKDMVGKKVKQKSWQDDSFVMVLGGRLYTVFGNK